MKVVIVNTHHQDSLGGSEIQCDIIASNLLKFGHEVVYLALKGKGTYNTVYPVKKVELSGRKIAKATIEENPDIIYWRNNKKAFYSSVKRISKSGIAIVFAVSSIPDTMKWRKFSTKPNNKSLIKHFLSNLKTIIKSRWNHNGFRWVDGIVVNNKEYLKRLNISQQIYIPNSNTTEYIPHEWNKPYISWVANFKSHKRPEICIELANNIKETDFVMVGNIQDDSYNYFKNPEKLPDNLFYLGPKSVKEVNGILQNSICLIHTCEPEGFPGNFIQSWLQGKPVISYEFDPGGIIETEELGFVSEANMDKFTNDVKKLIQDHELREDIGIRAKKYAKVHFHPYTNVKKLENFFIEILDNNG